MATVQETQDYLDEAGTPSILTSDEARAAIKAFVSSGQTLDEQVTLLVRLLQTAEIVEPDDELRGLFPEGFNKLGAIQREVANASEALRRVVAILREYDEFDARLRNAAEAAGYTV